MSDRAAEATDRDQEGDKGVGYMLAAVLVVMVVITILTGQSFFMPILLVAGAFAAIALNGYFSGPERT